MLLNPTLKQFLWLLCSYIIVVGIISFFLAGRELTVIATLAYIPLLVRVYKLQKVRDKSQLKDTIWVIFIIPCILLIWVGAFQHQITRKSFIHDKSQLKKITAIIPETYTDRLAEDKRHTSIKYYLTLQDMGTLKYVELQCAEHKEDYCERVYVYRGQVATVYYQPNTKYLNLAYEIVVNQKAIYRFDEQLALFKVQRTKENITLLWLFILYILPLFYIYRIYKNMIHYAEEMSDAEKQRCDEKRKNIINFQLDIGILGFFFLLIGLIILFYVLMFILHWLLFASFDDVKKSIFEIFLSLCVSIIFIFLPFYSAKMQLKNKIRIQKEMQQQVEKPLPHYHVPVIQSSEVLVPSLLQQNRPPKLYQCLIKMIYIILLMLFILIAGVCVSLVIMSASKQQWAVMWLFIILLLGSIFVIWRTWQALKSS